VAKSLVAIVGPTAIGKTALAIEVARTFNTVIVSADSRQFYREMTIGTAKPTGIELAAVPHFFINTLSITDDYSAGDFERDALGLLEHLFAQQDVVLLVGGSGLFVDAVCRGLDDLPKPAAGIRERLNALHLKRGLAYLQAELKRVDPQYYAEVDVHNPQRVIRALEVYESTGQPFSSFRQRQTVKRPFSVLKIGLTMDRERLYERINTRVDTMIRDGLLDEVKALLPHRDRPPLLTVGYAELFDYLKGKYSLEVAVDKIKQHTRRYAKRQLTWFRKDTATRWFEPAQLNEIIAYIRSTIKFQPNSSATRP